jgi:hypothetical protein
MYDDIFVFSLLFCLSVSFSFFSLSLIAFLDVYVKTSRADVFLLTLFFFFLVFLFIYFLFF